MGAARPSLAFEIMRQTGMLAVTAPELLEMVGCAQNAHHAYDVWNHTMACLDACPRQPIVRMAALLHDVGKPRVRAPGTSGGAKVEPTREAAPSAATPGEYTFYGHEIVGAAMARQLVESLRFSNQERDRIAALVNHHLILYSDEWTDAAVRRFIQRVSPDLLEDLLTLARADVVAKGTSDVEPNLAGLERLRARSLAILEAKHALTVRDLAIDGHDVMRELGIGPSRRIREVLDALFERVIEQPALNERATLLAMIREVG
jgi:tRNA nucleotidyltransferase (CCA-adding enzyme)